ncbi:hypothetical protein WN944_001068 [Citrus x changshan-huyou]|uniref:Reverse transcriptase domain-containing protein n=1 Tax=Citrus x changshan-huyou TaxID=2935761 RepID=A0AAP0QUF5_9ROSI
MLVLRLSALLSRIISPSQSGFVPVRVLHDNVLLVQELVHDINRRTRGGNVVLKLDMAKAYDRMSWSFILQMLRCFGFFDRWISLIKRAIYGPWFSILVNGVNHGEGFIGGPIGFFPLENLEQLFTRFLGCDTNSRRHIHWCRWPTVFFLEAEGGLGVPPFSDLADAFKMKAQNIFRFDFVAFNMDAVIFRVLLDLRLISSIYFLDETVAGGSEVECGWLFLGKPLYGFDWWYFKVAQYVIDFQSHDGHNTRCRLPDHDPSLPLLLDHNPSPPRLSDHELSPMIF